jgi:hypothetical protein
MKKNTIIKIGRTNFLRNLIPPADSLTAYKKKIASTNFYVKQVPGKKIIILTQHKAADFNAKSQYGPDHRFP